MPNNLLNYNKLYLIFIFQSIDFFETLVKVEENEGHVKMTDKVVL